MDEESVLNGAGYLSGMFGNSALRRDLATFAGKRVYFDPLEGNHGDTLIQQGAAESFQVCGVQLSESVDSADGIVINGGGGMFVQPWCGQLERLEQYTKKYPDKPILVLPSSYWWGDANLAGCFEGRTGSTVLFARDYRSMARLKDAGLPETVRLEQDHDMAFWLAETDLLRELRATGQEGYVLVVERYDAEQTTGSVLLNSERYGWSRALPRFVKDAGKRVLQRLRRMQSPLVGTSLEKAIGECPAVAGLDVVYEDVSNEKSYSFEHFVNRIASADAVITTRMHAGILSAMLGKPTFFQGVEDDYRKLESVYLYSCAALEHVHLLPAGTLS